MCPNKYAVTFACYNQFEYTRQCIDSLIKHGFDLRRLVVVDNGSTDATREYLSQFHLGALILNDDNLGCGVAWNQGALALQADWTIVMNNDVLVSKGWLEGLIDTAEKNGLKVISPALIEGELDYDFEAFAVHASGKMKGVLRLGGRHAVCLAVHKSVWMDVGYFQPVPKLLGYEDTIFFGELEKADIPMGITGASWLHHYGSITQTAMKKERGLDLMSDLGGRVFYRSLRPGWLIRKIKKIQSKSQARMWRETEFKNFGQSLHGDRDQGQFVWR